MTIENRPEIVTDSGSSIRNESLLTKEYHVTSAPLNISFCENGEWIPFEDTDLSPEEFYRRMRVSKVLPKTSGTITGKLFNLYDSHVQEDKSTISIHITSKHSGVYDSAVLAKNLIEEKYPRLFTKKDPHLFIEVFDSKSFSIGTWLLVEKAAELANEGYPFKDIARLILETLPKIDIFITLNSFENAVKGGRLPGAIGYIGDRLQLKPFVTMVDGELEIVKRNLTRTLKNAHAKLVERVANTKEEIVKMAIVHTNFPEGAENLKQSLSPVYSGEIRIFEAGPVLGVHAGEKGLGIALQRA